jgi:hypothetical protein
MLSTDPELRTGSREVAQRPCSPFHRRHVLDKLLDFALLLHDMRVEVDIPRYRYLAKAAEGFAQVFKQEDFFGRCFISFSHCTQPFRLTSPSYDGTFSWGALRIRTFDAGYLVDELGC